MLMAFIVGVFHKVQIRLTDTNVGHNKKVPVVNETMFYRNFSN